MRLQWIDWLAWRLQFDQVMFVVVISFPESLCVISLRLVQLSVGDRGWGMCRLVMRETCMNACMGSFIYTVGVMEMCDSNHLLITPRVTAVSDSSNHDRFSGCV